MDHKKGVALINATPFLIQANEFLLVFFSFKLMICKLFGKSSPVLCRNPKNLGKINKKNNCELVHNAKCHIDIIALFSTGLQSLF